MSIGISMLLPCTATSQPITTPLHRAGSRAAMVKAVPYPPAALPTGPAGRAPRGIRMTNTAA